MDFREKNMAGQIFVLIPTHNRKEILCNTIIKVRNQLPPGVARMVIVDAGSSDGTGVAVQALCPSAEIVNGDASMWWTATVNHGLKYIKQTAQAGDCVILMNDDVDLAPNALHHLIDASYLEQRSIIGAVNLMHCPDEENALVYFCGGHYDLRFSRHRANIRQGTPWRAPQSRFLETDFIYGRLLVMPWAVFESDRYFDEVAFPQYLADEEFTYNAKLRGYKLLVDCNSIVYVNNETTAKFSLSFVKEGAKGVWSSLTSFNSCYNLKQNWEFSRRYTNWPVLFIIFRYGIIFFNENFRTTCRRS